MWPRSRSPDRIRDALLRQLCNPVRWVEGVELGRPRRQHIVECGPGRVLAGLNKRITPEPKTVSLKDAAVLRELAAQSKE